MDLRDKVHNSYSDNFFDLKRYALFDKEMQIEENSIIDLMSFDLIEVKNLFDAIDHTETEAGRTVLFRSLGAPLVDEELITAKQEAVREIQNDPNLRKKLDDFLVLVKKNEPVIYNYFFHGASSNTNYKNARKALLEIVEISQNLKAQSPYLKILIDDILSFNGTRAHKLLEGPVYKVSFLKNNALRHKKEIKFYVPVVRFFMNEVKFSLLLLFGLAYFDLQLLFVTLFAFLQLRSILLVYDKRKFVEPLRDIYLSDDGLRKFFEAIGKIDEILSFIKYSESISYKTVLPEVKEDRCHHMILRGAVNPVLSAKESIKAVLNDVNLKDVFITSITGPNSGGKTTYCKKILQIQILAQIGSFVPAQKAEISIAHKMAYQAPLFDSLESDEGRFGTELERTRDIFFDSDERSLIVLDELAQGTTVEEEFQHSDYIGEGFFRLGGNMLLVTHNHALVDYFQNKNIGQALMTEFNDFEPTHKIIRGVSRVSHADRVAEKIGFSKNDVEEYLRAKNKQ